MAVLDILPIFVLDYYSYLNQTNSILFSTVTIICNMKKLLLCLSFVLVSVCGNAQKNPVLTIEGGQVQGIVADDHPDVYVYRGIPYATPQGQGFGFGFGR